MAFIKAQDIYEATNGGLDIILRYIPDAADSVQKRNKLFRFDAYDTKPGCSLYAHDGLWWVKNHGESDPSMNPLEVVMKLFNCDFVTSIKTVASDFGITVDEKAQPKIRADYRKLPVDGQTEGWYELEFRDFTVVEMKAIFSNEIWTRLCYQQGQPLSDEKGLLEGTKLCKHYNFHALAWYRFWARDKETKQPVVHEFRSNEFYPIFCFDEGEFKKIYKPKERDTAYRFSYFGTKPAKYLHGLAQHTRLVLETNLARDKAYTDLSEEEKKKARKEDFLLDDIVLVSGGSDAINIAALGYHPVWKNSENDTFTEKDYKTLGELTKEVYQLPDLDATGIKEAHKLAMQFLDLRTIWLPDTLGEKKDWRGNTCKDVRDYFRWWKAKDFTGLVENAYPLKFWEESPKLDKNKAPIYRKGKALMKYTPHPVLVMNFLYRNGFARLHAPSNPETTFIYIQGNIVRKVETKDVREFLRKFLESRHVDWDLRVAFARTTDVSDGMLEQLPERRLEFSDFCPDSQWMFFQNVSWEIRAGQIIEHKPEKAGRFVWEHEVIPHQVKLEEPVVTVTRSGDGPTARYALSLAKAADGHPPGMFLRYLIQASRVYWRKELEEGVDGLSEALREPYRQVHRYDITGGTLLTAQERAEQEQHLINKLAAFGYMLHRYKDAANAYCVWSTDYLVRNTDESHGGTGKSLAASSLLPLMQTETLEGRDPKLTQNPHVFENVTEHTDLILLDDAQKYIQFEFFFSLITSFIKVNPKGKKSFSVPAELAPKLHITSNFPPLRADTSTMRRIWFMAYSDYFHYNPQGEYREERRPIDEFGKRFFKEDFGDQEWNHFLNLMARCVQMWLNLGKVSPPMEALMNNAYKNKIGAEFLAWADVYFSHENGTLNSYVQRQKGHETYKREVSNQLTPQKWEDKLEDWCRFKGYVFNPPGIKGYREDGKRITYRGFKEVWQNNAWQRTGEGKTSLEYVYIQTPGAEITENGLDTDLGGI